MYIITKHNKKDRILYYRQDILTGKLTKISHWDIKDTIKSGRPIIVKITEG